MRPALPGALHVTLHWAEEHENRHNDLGDNIEFFCKCNVGLEPDTKPYKKTFLKKKNFDLSQKTPSLCQITFHTRTSKIKKIKFTITNFLTFSFRIWLHLVRRFRKGITLGVISSETHPQPHPPTAHPPPTHPNYVVWLHDPKCYTFLESSHQM